MLSFCNIADQYDEHADVQRDIIAWAKEHMDFVYDQDILELGAGTGLLTEQLLARGARSVFATDISENMLSVCDNRFCSHPRVSCQLMNAWVPNVHGFDALYSSNLLQWAREPGEVLQHWTRCLRPEGGHICAVFFIEETLQELREVLPSYLLPVQFRSKSYWENAFESAGLRIRLSRDEVRQHWYDSAVALFQNFRDTGVSARNRLSYGVLRRALKEYQKRFGFNGKIKSTWHYFHIEAYLD